MTMNMFWNSVDPTTTQLKFPIWTCNIPICCTTITYKVMQDNTPTEFPPGSIFSHNSDGTEVTLTVDSSTLGSTDFWLEGESNFGKK